MKRLDALASVIAPADVIADVGCDHGYVAEYCVNSRLAKRVIASDISDACLDKARRVLKGKANVSIVLCDGIGYECDEAVIAGMGGALICGILDRANSQGLLPKTLVLLPHRNVDQVRRKINELGYGIDVDFMIEDGGKFYSVIRAQKSVEAQTLTPIQYLFGAFCEKKSDTLKAYLINQYNTYMVAPERNKEILSNISVALKIQDDGATDI